MNILALDTSTPILSIALETDKSYEERLIDGAFSHSEDLLTEIEALLERANLELKDLNMLFVTKGPGSFTGLRVGMASMKGIASALSIPLVSIPTLEVIENAVKPYSGPILSVIDAKKKKFYLRLSENREVLIEDRDGNAEDIIEELRRHSGILITGPDAAKFSAKLKEEYGFYTLCDPLAPRNLSRSLIELGKRRFEEKGADDIGEGPVYIRRSDAEEALLKKMSEENA